MNNPTNFIASLENMTVAMQDTAATLGNQGNNGNGGNGDDGPMTLATFLKVHLPTFKGTSNPTEANNWFQAMEKYFPNSVRMIKELELLQLMQDSMSVTEYTNKFEELCRFSKIGHGAPEGFEQWKCIKYESGFRSEILSTMGPMEIRIFSELVNKSRVTEDCVRNAALDKGDHRAIVRGDQGRNFAPRGQDFK
ncbi:uncharacterized protein LOC130981354 [Arachis stenosperma]|uniref:uncharacterized protein LOC130981354 n=1 Tax=Arachis stenosperma TaxID=217475 RepID=UPI0025ABEBAC|nr:uncharacterized protein LOC130981354 [Arachis stenosperma]